MGYNRWIIAKMFYEFPEYCFGLSVSVCLFGSICHFYRQERRSESIRHLDGIGRAAAARWLASPSARVCALVYWVVECLHRQCLPVNCWARIHEFSFRLNWINKEDRREGEKVERKLEKKLNQATATHLSDSCFGVCLCVCQPFFALKVTENRLCWFRRQQKRPERAGARELERKWAVTVSQMPIESVSVWASGNNSGSVKALNARIVSSKQDWTFNALLKQHF